MTRDSRDPPQWREGKPGWGFDRWSVARGGKSYEPELADRSYGVDRAVAITGWILAIGLLVAATFTEATGLALAAFAVIVAAVISRKLIKRWRRTHAPAGD